MDVSSSQNHHISPVIAFASPLGLDADDVARLLAGLGLEQKEVSYKWFLAEELPVGHVKHSVRFSAWGMS
jgi:hypothetical protein